MAKPGTAAATRELERDTKRLKREAKYNRAVAKHNRAADVANRAGTSVRRPRARRGGGGLGLAKDITRGPAGGTFLLIGIIAFLGLGGLGALRGAFGSQAPQSAAGGDGGTDITDLIPDPGAAPDDPNNTPGDDTPGPQASHQPPPSRPNTIIIQPGGRVGGHVGGGGPIGLVLPGLGGAPQRQAFTYKESNKENPRIGDFIRYTPNARGGDLALQELTRLHYPTSGPLTGAERIALGQDVRGTRDLERRVQADRRAGRIAPTPRGTIGTGTYRDPIRQAPRTPTRVSYTGRNAPGSTYTNILGRQVTAPSGGGNPGAPPPNPTPPPARTPKPPSSRRTNTPGIPSTTRGRQIYNSYLRYRAGGR